MLKKAAFAIIGLPLLAMLITNAGWAWGPLVFISEQKAIFWACGAGLLGFSVIKDARILIPLVLIVFLVAQWLI